MNDLLARALQRGDVVHEALARAWERSLSLRRDRAIALERRLNAQNPAQRLTLRAQRLASLRARLDALPARLGPAWRTRGEAHAGRLLPAWERFYSLRKHEVEVAATRLASVDPNAPLARGYAMILRDGALVRSAADVAPGDAISARLGHGTLDARVEAVHDE
jgi:exodeoxyribonuclease VII large subunit